MTNINLVPIYIASQLVMLCVWMAVPTLSPWIVFAPALAFCLHVSLMLLIILATVVGIMLAGVLWRRGIH